MSKINVLIAGSTGYIGIQLIKLLVKHKYIILNIYVEIHLQKKYFFFDKSLKNKKLPKIIKFKKNI